MIAKKKVLITGGTGFVGANLTRRLVAEGHEVHLLVRPQYSAWRIDEIRTHIRIHLAALENDSLLQQVMERVKPDWIFHLATHGAYPTQTDTRQMINTNIVGLLNLLAAAGRVGFASLVNVGSSSEYGFKEHAPKESELVEPNSDYAITKAAATFWCQLTAVRHRVYIPTLRLYSVYGPYEEPSRLLPTLIWHARQGKWPPLAEPKVARDFVYVDDVVDALLLAAQKRPRALAPIYNVGSGKQTRLRQLVNEIRHLFGVRARPRWATMPKRQWDTAFWVATSAKIRRELGWKPRHRLSQGLRKLSDWLGNPRWNRFYQKFYDS